MEELIRELKQQGVLKSPCVEAAFRAIDRRDFVRPEHRAEAYANCPLDIGAGQTISQPYTVAFMLDLLDPRPGEKILDIGTGSGWTTALLAHIVSAGGKHEAGSMKHESGKVYAIERIPELYRFGRANVAKYNFLKRRVVKFFSRDGTAGLPTYAPFDKILASAAAGRAIPTAWREQLAAGGSIIAPVGGSVWHYRNIAPERWEEREYSGFAFVPLVDGRKKSRGGPPHQNLWRGGGQTFNLAVAILAIISALLYVTFVPARLSQEQSRFAIPPGAGSRAIGQLLKSQGIVRSKWVFVTYAAMTGEADRLKPGIYEVGAYASIPGLVQTIVRGGLDPNERFITIPEGWDQRQIGAYFEREGLFPAEQWWAEAGLPAHDYRADRPPAPTVTSGPAGGPPDNFRGEFPSLADRPRFVGLEGYLYPDTYRVFRDARPADIIRAMLLNFEEKLDPELRREILRQNKTIFEIVTMASLLEQESPKREDRRIIAGILWKRLATGMPLQVDASVNYATGKRHTPSARDLAVDSPYNTYRSPGLPLGPIANPGVEAISAALWPEPSDYLYYLTAPDGKTIFSRTLPEHAAAKNRYLR